MSQLIWTHEGSNDAVWAKEVYIKGGINVKLHLGVQIPQDPQFLGSKCQIFSKMNTVE